MMMATFGIKIYEKFSTREYASLEQYSANSLANLKMYESLVRMNEAELQILGSEYEKGNEVLYSEPEKFYASLQESERIIARIPKGVHGKIPELLTKVELNWQQYRAQLPGTDGDDQKCEACDHEAARIVAEFFGRIPAVREILATDVQAAFDGDPAWSPG